jgi:hypothetical protein
MQALPFLGFELFQRLQADLEMLADALAVEFAGHAGKLDFTVERLVRDAQQGAVGDAEAQAVWRRSSRTPCRARQRATATGAG